MDESRITKDVISKILGHHPEILNYLDDMYRRAAYAFYIEGKKPKDLKEVVNDQIDVISLTKKLKLLVITSCVLHVYKEILRNGRK